MIDLSLLMPDFADELREFVVEANYQGFPVDVESAFRSNKDQDRLWSLGRTVRNPDGASSDKPLGNTVTNARGGYSYHNYGLAADIVFKDLAGKWNWNRPASDYTELAKLAENYGLEWGGNWQSARAKSLADLDHFQMTNGLTIHEALEIGDINKVWAEVKARGK